MENTKSENTSKVGQSEQGQDRLPLAAYVSLLNEIFEDMEKDGHRVDVVGAIRGDESDLMKKIAVLHIYDCECVDGKIVEVKSVK